MRVAGIGFMGTGGLGGVHRGFPAPPDVSADLGELARAQALVVSAGVKSLLDVPATAEVLETLGVPVLGWRTDTMPLFYAAEGGPAGLGAGRDGRGGGTDRRRALAARPPHRARARAARRTRASTSSR